MVTTSGGIPDERLPEVRRRLIEVRGDLSYRKTAAKLEEHGIKAWAADVRRFEGLDRKRPKSKPSMEYIDAFSQAFDVPQTYLVAEDVPIRGGVDLVEHWRKARKSFQDLGPRPPENDQDRISDQLRDAVHIALIEASGLPFPQKSPFVWVPPFDTLTQIHMDLQRLFWEAFMSRGLTEERLVELAVDFGRLIPTPPDLSSEGFYRWSEAGEDTIRRWWTLQSEALRVLVRPHDFRLEDMNLPRGATGGYPTPLELHLMRLADRTVPERQETISRALKVLYPEPEKEEDDDAISKATDGPM